ncbi:MAG: hypothetical protein ACI9FU_000088 [Granulosicoccus sp.]|jgi:uncharacterized protein (DUF885 family)
MKNTFLLFVLSFVFASCGTTPATMPQGSNAQFDGFKNRFIEAFWELHPQWAAQKGYHKYDAVINIPNDAGREAKTVFVQAYTDSLTQFKSDELSNANQCDFFMIQDQLESMKWYQEVYRSWEWNPSSYNLGEGFALIINGRYASLDERISAMAERLKSVPAYYEAATSNISNPTLEHTELGIMRNKGSLDVFNATMIDSVDASGLADQEKQDLKANIELAKMAISDYITFLENDILPNLNENTRSFRIGKDLFAQKFDIDIRSSYSAEQVYDFALESKKQVHSEMLRLTTELWPKYFEGAEMPDSMVAIRTMIEKLSLNHVHRDSFQSTIEQQIPELTKFVQEHDLVYLDPAKPLVVRREPAYMGGFAGASISAPGPYDKFADTYYNVGPMDRFNDEQAESFLREYNHHVLQILNIHEAIPGHYAQLVYSNLSPSLVKSIFGNGAMVEGWAVYTERMMLEEGYGDHEPELWLMYYKWNLRVVCNTILDYSIHVKDWTKEQGLDLLTNQAFQQDAEANGKWRRATLSQVQLCSYYTGFKEIYDLRSELKEKQGNDFNLKAFHEELLSFGSAPVKYVRDLMLNKTPT